MKTLIAPMLAGLFFGILLIAGSEKYTEKVSIPHFERRKMELRQQGYEIISEERPMAIGPGATITAKKDGEIILFKYQGDFVRLDSIQSTGKAR